MAIQHQQTSFLSVGHEIGCVFGEITYERLSIIERVAEQMSGGSRLTHTTFRKSGERIRIGGIHQPAMRPERGQLIQLTIERDVRGTGISRTGQGNEVAF